MIKIIKPGKVTATTCPYCECVFSFEKEDIKYGNQKDPCKEVICPCCAQTVDLFENKVYLYEQNQ